jgi:HisA/HisF family protein
MVMRPIIEYFLRFIATQKGQGGLDIIPVIDLKGGLVVHARRGDRAHYRPIETPLSPSAEPVAVTRGLMALHDFRRLYIADLDAIAGQDDNREGVAAIHVAFPTLELWVDRGIATPEAARAWAAQALGPVVVGSESAPDLDMLLATLAAGGPDAVLSLDYRGEDFQGPRAILERPQNWPRRVVAMTLARVGSGAGPDLDKLDAMKSMAGLGRAVYAAGGVRNADDLDALRDHGIAGALVATSLHDGRLDKAALRRFTKNETGGVSPAGP